MTNPITSKEPNADGKYEFSIRLKVSKETMLSMMRIGIHAGETDTFKILDIMNQIAIFIEPYIHDNKIIILDKNGDEHTFLLK